jgi:hypothetical protein
VLGETDVHRLDARSQRFHYGKYEGVREDEAKEHNFTNGPIAQWLGVRILGTAVIGHDEPDEDYYNARYCRSDSGAHSGGNVVVNNGFNTRGVNEGRHIIGSSLVGLEVGRNMTHSEVGMAANEFSGCQVKSPVKVRCKTSPVTTFADLVMAGTIFICVFPCADTHSTKAKPSGRGGEAPGENQTKSVGISHRTPNELRWTAQQSTLRDGAKGNGGTGYNE